MRSRESWTGDLQRLDAQGLIERKTVTVNREPMPSWSLTRDGKALLEAQAGPRRGPAEQHYHAGLVKPREAAHDAQLLSALSSRRRSD